MNGTYGARDTLQAAAQCSGCDPGYYCSRPGLSGPSGPCQAGYVCVGGASNSTPTDGVTGALCPAGYYCPQGSGSGMPIPPPSSDPLILCQCKVCAESMAPGGIPGSPDHAAAGRGRGGGAVSTPL